LADGIGQITRPIGSAIDPVAGTVLAREMQRILVEETRLGIPAISHDEALAGFQSQAATQFPQSIGLACTWRPELVEAMAAVIRRQVRATGVQHVLSPVLDVTRDARWGRVEETYGEDKYLVSRMAVAFVRGMQGDDPTTGVMATLKHFAGYSASEGGRNWAPVHAGWREMYEVFLFPFEVAIREAGAQAVMNSYSEIDGVPANASRRLLTDILRGEWGFDGLVVADYNSIGLLHHAHHVADGPKGAAVLAVRAGMDTEYPREHAYGTALVEAVEEGLVDEREIDVLVRRVLTWKFRLGLFENPYGEAPDKIMALFDTPADRSLAREIAEQTIVLLKNDGVLPLNAAQMGSVAVIGPNADRARGLLCDYHFTTMVESIAAMAGGSLALVGAPGPQAEFDPLPVVTVRAGIGANGVAVRYAPGCDVDTDDRSGFAEAVQAARDSDVAVVVLGDQSGVIGAGTVGEGRDGATLALPGVQEDLLAAVAATGTPVVVVLTNGRPFALETVDALANAVVEAWFPGEEGGTAIASVLFGTVNPGGHLSVTLPRAAGVQPYSYDHRHFGAHDYVDVELTPVYPFGHGLSYTTFEYTDLVITPTELATDGTLTVACTVTNTGALDGDEVVQLYLRDLVGSVTRPVLELHGFVRVTLTTGESAIVTFSVPADRLALWNEHLELVVEPGEHEVFVGSSSADIRLRGRFTVTGDAPRTVEPATRALRSEVDVTGQSLPRPAIHSPTTGSAPGY
jgi:beta-glucosidase